MCAAGVRPDFACVLQASGRILHVCYRRSGGLCMCVTIVQEYLACIIQVLRRDCISVTGSRRFCMYDTGVGGDSACMLQVLGRILHMCL